MFPSRRHGRFYHDRRKTFLSERLDQRGAIWRKLNRNDMDKTFKFA